jgi:ribosomal protein L30/L7E
MNKKDFDSVELMRLIRRKRQIEYETNPQLRGQRLAEIRKKYKKIIKIKEYASH